MAASLSRIRRGLAATTGLGPIAQMGAGSVAVAAMNLAAGALTARALGPEMRGDLLILTLYAVAAGNALILGLDVTLPQLMRRHALPRPNAIALAAATTLAATLVAAAAALAWGLLSGRHAAGVVLAHLPLAIAYFAAGHISILAQGLIIGEERYRLYTALRVVMPVIVLTGVAVAWGAGLGLAWVYGAYVLGAMVYPAATLWLWSRNPNYDRSYRYDRGLFIRYGGSAAALHLARILEMNCIAFVVTLFGERAEAGIYAVAFAAANVVVIVSEALQRFAFGSTLARKVESAEEFRAWMRQLRRTALVYLGGSVAIAGPLAWLLIPYVYGAEFTSARLVVLPLMLAALLGAVAGLHVEIAKGRGLAHLAIAPKLAAAATVFAVAGLDIGEGLFGAGLLARLCAAFVLAQGIQLALLQWALWRHLRRNP